MSGTTKHREAGQVHGYDQWSIFLRMLGAGAMGLEFAESVQEKQGERRIAEFKRSHFADFENLLSDIQWIINEANKRGLFHAQYFVPFVKLGGSRWNLNGAMLIGSGP